jgi:hypothetical protein
MLKTIELEFNIMSVKDLASNMIGEMVGQPESEDIVSLASVYTFKLTSEIGGGRLNTKQKRGPFSLGGDPSRNSPSTFNSIMATKRNWLVYAYPGYQEVCFYLENCENQSFLQCSEPSALHFYTMTGFRQINKGERNDGYGWLPEHVHNALEAQSEPAFWRFPLSESLVAENHARTPTLMHLRPGGLKHVTSVKANSKKAEQEASKEKHWHPGQCLIGANILLPN